MKLFDVSAKTFREVVRDRKTLAITLGLPLIFLGIFGLAFGQSDTQDTYQLSVSDEDNSALSAAFVAGLRDLQYDDGQPVFSVHTNLSNDEASRALQKREHDGWLVVPVGFEAGLTPQGGTQAGPLPNQPGTPGSRSGSSVRLTGDPSYVSFGIVQRIVDAYVAAFESEVTGTPDALVVEQQSFASDELTPFDFIAPGLMVFAVLNLTPQAAALLAKEKEHHTLERLRLSRMRTIDLLGGVGLTQLVFTSISIVLMFATALALGYRPTGSLLVGLLIVLMAGVSIIGVGLMISAFSDKADDAANLGALFAVPASFLSGAFFRLPTVHLFDLGSHPIDIYDILPTSHAVTGLQRVLTLGAPLAEVSFEIVALLVLSVAYFIVGVMLYQWRRMTAGA